MTRTNWLAVSAIAALLGATRTSAQQPENCVAPPPVGEVIEIPQPPATAYHGLEMVLHMPFPGKPIVTCVHPGSPAESAGFQVGDTMELFDGGDPVETKVNFRRLTPGREYRVTVRRGGEAHTLLLVPAAPREDQEPE